MRSVRIQRPSPAMIVAILALVVALGGTAFAGPVAKVARLISGDKTIKKGSLSGNRLRKHTITATQLNMAKLGTVPSATRAKSADSATHATGADSSGHATTADNATHATSADAATHATGADSATIASSLVAPAAVHAVGA